MKKQWETPQIKKLSIDGGGIKGVQEGPGYSGTIS